jgi:hypothetical protein
MLVDSTWFDPGVFGFLRRIGMADSKADAPFVFEGSVKSISDSNVSAVPADERTAVIQVDHIRLAPRALAGFAGKEITLRMAPHEKLAAGDKSIFFTDSLVFADHLAVQSMGHDPLVATEAKAALAGVSPVVQKLRRRIDQANAVVSGQVTEVRPYAPATVKAMAATGPAMPAGRISEHAPFWHEAVIDVSGVHKGPKQKKVVVRFPTSTDVKWRKAPHFKKGQKGIWLLHSGSLTPAKAKSAAAMLKAAAAPPAAGFYTALDPNDFHPATEAPVVQTMLPAPMSTAKKPAAKAAATKKPALKKAAAKPPAKALGKKRRS